MKFWPFVFRQNLRFSGKIRSGSQALACISRMFLECKQARSELGTDWKSAGKVSTFNRFYSIILLSPINTCHGVRPGISMSF